MSDLRTYSMNQLARMADLNRSAESNDIVAKALEKLMISPISERPRGRGTERLFRASHIDSRIGEFKDLVERIRKQAKTNSSLRRSLKGPSKNDAIMKKLEEIGQQLARIELLVERK